MIAYVVEMVSLNCTWHDLATPKLGQNFLKEGLNSIANVQRHYRGTGWPIYGVGMKTRFVSITAPLTKTQDKTGLGLPLSLAAAGTEHVGVIRKRTSKGLTKRCCVV